MMNIIEIYDLNKSFDGLIVTRNLSFKVEVGEFFGILGPNGAGKTTLFNEITGFIHPDNGKIIYKGKDIIGLKPYQISNLGIVRTFQLVRPFKECTVRENIIIPSVSPRMKKKLRNHNELNKWVEKIAEFCDLKDLLDKKVEFLPYGVLRKLEIAKALAMSPDLLLLDEPFSGISEQEITPLSKIIKNANKSGTTIILIEHKLREFMKLVNRILVIDHGEEIAMGTPNEIVNNKAVIESYMGGEYNETS
ncbi:MAG: ABC transporter ATP-binding protein [Caldisericum exile]|uniref:ABC transporter ATP-binding protein n=1 Tax=Caldisericum exile TaxID=693075 RepID=A0A2J6X709_9BACT|nr:MAG: ABC transporter ATP-binding protein [Caldisericum exile]